MAKINLGRVVGYSAYELALQNGYVGTEEEWLASLHGKDGEFRIEELTPEEKEKLRGPAGPAGSDYVITDADYEAIANIAAGKVNLNEYVNWNGLEGRLQTFEMGNNGGGSGSGSSGGSGGGEENHIIRKNEFDSSISAFVNEDRVRAIVDEKLGSIANAEEGAF